MQIYIHRDGHQYGPYSIAQSRTLLASGNLLTSDLAWYEGAPNWAPLGELPEIASDRSQNMEPSWVPPRRDGTATAHASPASQTQWNVAAENPPALPRISEPVAKSHYVRKLSPSSPPGSNYITRQQRAIGARYMGVGALIFIVGMSVTVFSYMAAAESPGGGHYVLAWGAIGVGAIRFIAGLAKYLQG